MVEKQVMQKLKGKLDHMKEVVLTKKESIEQDKALKELEEGKTFSLEDIKKDRKRV